MDNQSAGVRVLHIWTKGDAQAGIGSESAEVTAPESLLTSEGVDPDEFQLQLTAFKAKIIEAFAIIWDDKPQAMYDFELTLGSSVIGEG